MNDRPIGAVSSCQEFFEELDRLPPELPKDYRAVGWRSLLSQGVREHILKCAECEAAFDDFVATRQAFHGMLEDTAQPGPWFVSRVMAKIRAQERELEEQANGVWINVMKLAPKLSAVAAVLLLVGGTWAMQLRRVEQSRQQSRAAEGLFESAPNAPLNDDIVASGYEERQP
jgi:hypothetical protein